MASAIVIVVVSTLAWLMVPVTFLTTHPSTAGDPSWARIPGAEVSSVTIRQENAGATELTIALVPPEYFTEQLVSDSSGFRYDSQARVWRAEGPATLTVEGTFADISVALNSATTAAGVTVTRKGPERPAERHRLAAPSGAEPWSATTLPTSRVVFARSDSLATAVIQTEGNSEVPATAEVAGIPVTSEELTSTGGRALMMAGAKAVARGASITLLATLLLLACWTVGRSLDGSQRSGAVADVVRLGAGFCLMAAAINTLSYVVPALWATGVVAGLASILVILRWVTRRPEAVSASMNSLLRSVLWVVPSTVAAFLPLLFWGGHWVGRFNTDLFEYATLATIVRDHSLLAMQDLPLAQESGILTSGAGISWRSIDSVAAAAVAVLPGVNTLDAFTLLGLTLFLIWGLAAVAIVSLFGGGRWQRAAVALALFAPAFAGLFVENYNSHYFFVALVPLLVLAIAHAQSVRDAGGLIRFPEVATAATAAAMVAVFPYFCVIVLVALLLPLLVSSPRRRFLFRRGPILVIETLLIVNLALLTVLNYSSTQIYKDALNNIARYVLLVPFGPIDLVGVGLGVVPYQWREPVGAPQPWMGTLGHWLWSSGESITAVDTLAMVGLILAIIGLIVGIEWRSSMRNFAFLALLMVVVAFGVLTLYLLLSNDLYAALKAGWTGVAVLPIVIAGASLRPRLQLLVVALLIPLALVWVRTSLLDRISYLVVRDAPAVVMLRGHDPLEPEIASIEQELMGAGSVAILVGPQPLVGSDRERVGLAQSLVAARDLGLDCVDCGEPFDTYESTYQCRDVAVASLVVVGVTGRREFCGHPLVYRGGVIEVFR